MKIIALATLCSMLIAPGASAQEPENSFEEKLQQHAKELQGKSFVETKSNTLFPLTIYPLRDVAGASKPATAGLQVLTGAGSYTLEPSGGDLISAGLYLDLPHALGYLSKFASDNPKDLHKQPELHKTLMREKLAKSLRIVALDDLPKGKLNEIWLAEIQAALEPAAQALDAEEKAKTYKLFATFKDRFNGAIPKGGMVLLTMDDRGYLHLNRDSSEQTVIFESAPLGQAVFAAWLGDKPVSKELRQELVQDISRLVPQ